MSPAVSVILPVRDGGGYLEGAVESILSQTFADFELLLIDDHSTDGAVEGLRRDDARLRVLASRGAGVVPAFATGLAAAGGRFIARMDADDISLPGRLATQLDYLSARPDVGIAGGCVEFFAAAGVGEGNRAYRDWLNGLREPGDIRRAMFIESPLPNPTAVFRRSVLARLGGYRDTPWPEDYDLFLRANEAEIRMGKPSGVVLHWRDHGKRLTRTDPRYAIGQFQRAKAHYLARMTLPGDELLLWGAGPTGRQLYDLLAEEGVTADGFVEVHPRRIGGYKRGKPVHALERAADPGAFVLVAVGARNARADIRAWFDRRGRREGRDYLFAA